MEKKDLKVAFMGTPDFALPVLEALVENYSVVCVITKVDKPKGRGYELVAPPVKNYAVSKNIPVLQPATVKTDEFVEELKSYGAELFVTCAYGKILPQQVLDIPKYGTINVHASLLPKYRGSAPLWHMVINGEKEIGVTTMFTDIGMDTGDILEVSKIPFGEDETMENAHDKLSALGGEIITRTIDKMLAGTLTRTKQNDAEATYAPPIKKEDGKIDWSKPADAIHNLVRGMNPFPAAFTLKQGEVLKIFKTKCVNESTAKAPGTVLGVSSNGGLLVACGDETVIEVLELQAAGKKRMDTKAYLNGHPIAEGVVFES